MKDDDNDVFFYTATVDERGVHIQKRSLLNPTACSLISVPNPFYHKAVVAPSGEEGCASCREIQRRAIESETIVRKDYELLIEKARMACQAAVKAMSAITAMQPARSELIDLGVAINACMEVVRPGILAAERAKGFRYGPGAWAIRWEGNVGNGGCYRLEKVKS